MTHLVRAEADSPAPIETVWHLLSTVETWPTWSRHKLARLERPGNPTPNGLGAIRVLGIDPAKPTKCNREEVVVFDAPTHFGYKLLSGQPLDNYVSNVTLLSLPGGKTHITWESRFATHGPTGWLWVLVVRWVLRRWTADLARGAAGVGATSDPALTPRGT